MFPIYVINLKGSEQRLARASQQLSAQRLSFERIDAVNGRLLNTEQKHAVVDPQANRQKFYRPLSDGEIGCYLSHKKCWQRLLDSHCDYAVILEDDFTATGNLKNCVEVAMKSKLPLDIVKLCNYQGRERPVKYQHALSNKHTLVVHDKPLSGCCAYIITRAGAKRMLAHAQKIYRPVDTDIQHTWETGVSVGAIQPYPVLQDNFFDSDIASRGRNKPKAYPLQKQLLAIKSWPKAQIARRQLIYKLHKGDKNLISAPVTNT